MNNERCLAEQYSGEDKKYYCWFKGVECDHPNTRRDCRPYREHIAPRLAVAYGHIRQEIIK